MKYSDLIAQEEIEALHFAFDYSTLDVFEPLKNYIEQTGYWIYDGNGRWSTSNKMVRLRNDEGKSYFEVWLISGEVKCIYQLNIDDADSLLHQLKRIGI